jgi:hypothetical protein
MTILTRRSSASSATFCRHDTPISLPKSHSLGLQRVMQYLGGTPQAWSTQRAVALCAVVLLQALRP